MESYDVIIIGTGAGGGTLAHRLAPSGKRILILERGGFLPREKQNWESAEVFLKARYHTNEMWRDKKGRKFMPGTGYYVGGNTKVFGGAMFRLRERDFETVQHKGGISPEWPVKYRDFEPYYGQAEKIYGVHGQRGIDPTEPKISEDASKNCTIVWSSSAARLFRCRFLFVTMRLIACVANACAATPATGIPVFSMRNRMPTSRVCVPLCNTQTSLFS